MPPQVANEAKTEFYKWLEKNLPSIFDSREVQQALTKQIKVIHPDLNWEVGPGTTKKRFLAFSPSLNENLLSLTNELAKNAPIMADWEFLPAKPPKNWKTRNVKINSGGKVIQINFDNWNYFLTSFNNGEFFDVNLVPKNLPNIDEEDLAYAAELFAEFELGEELYIMAVDRVNLVKPEDLEEDTDQVKYLREHLLSQWSGVQ